jgi:hypothetical protein
MGCLCCCAKCRFSHQQFAGCKLIFFDAGTYYITDTLTIPAGSQVAGEAWSVMLGGGPNFQDEENPKVMVRAGEPYCTGILEITDIVFSTVAPGMLHCMSLPFSTQSSKHRVPSSSSGTYTSLGMNRAAQACGIVTFGVFNSVIPVMILTAFCIQSWRRYVLCAEM